MKYLSGNLNLGVLGQVKIFVFENKNKKDDKQPDYSVCKSLGEDKGLLTVGALWENESKEKEEEATFKFGKGASK